MKATCILALAAALCCASAVAADLKVGDPAPVFNSTDDQGKPWKSTDYVGKKILVVYFYPADMTGGCTKQACGFRDDMKKLQDQGVEVVGVSGDAVRNHQLFKKVHNLNFTLLADEDHAVCDLYGVWAEKKNYGRTYWGALRSTFIIDPDGKVARVFPKVSPKTHDEVVLKALGELAAA